MRTMKQTITFATGIGLSVLGYIIYLASSRPAIDPMSAIYFSRPVPLTRKYVSDVSVKINDVDITKEGVAFRVNSKITITGKCSMNPQYLQEYRQSGLIVGY